jgi:hypothetical protein
MPLTESKSNPKKKSGGFGWGSIAGVGKDFLRGGQEAARGLPTGIKVNAKALAALAEGDPRPFMRMGQQMARQTATDVRHPLRDPFSTFLTALALGSLGGGASARVAAAGKALGKTGSASKALKAGAKKPVYTRKFKGVRAPEAERKGPKSLRKYQTPRSYEVKASSNPLVRGARKVTVDPLYDLSRKRAEAGKKGGGYAKKIETRTREERARFAKQARADEPGGAKATGKAIGPELLQAPMNLLRMKMVLNPRYYAQNLTSSGLMLALQQGPHGLVKSSRTAKRVRKEDPSVAIHARSTMGDPAQAAGMIESSGALSGVSQKMAHYANVPESRLRELAFYAAARKHGITKTKDLKNLLNNPTSNRFHQIAKDANDSMGDYSRLGKGERAFMRTGIPIFYPMFKALSRYGAQFPFEHSIAAGMANQIGQEGYDQQMEDFGGELPPWSPYLTKFGNDETSNFQNIHPFSPVADISEAASQIMTPGGGNPTRSLLQYAGPAPELLYGMATGNQLQTGWPIKGMDEGMSPLEAALRDFAPNIPGKDYLDLAGITEPRTTKAYGKPTQEDLFWMWLLGPAYPRKTNMRELKKQAKQQR